MKMVRYEQLLRMDRWPIGKWWVTKGYEGRKLVYYAGHKDRVTSLRLAKLDMGTYTPTSATR